jgi:hypothetical protein
MATLDILNPMIKELPVLAVIIHASVITVSENICCKIVIYHFNERKAYLQIFVTNICVRMKWHQQRIVIDLIRPLGNKNQRMGQTLTPRYTRGGIRCLGRVSISCRPAASAVSTISRSGKRYEP